MPSDNNTKNKSDKSDKSKDDTPEYPTSKMVREGVTWRVVQSLATDILCSVSKRYPIELSQVEIDNMLAPWRDRMAYYFDILVEVQNRAQSEALGTLSAADHAAAVQQIERHGGLDAPPRVRVDTAYMAHPRHGR